MSRQYVGNEPEVRFQGFDQDWLEKRISEILSEAKRSIVLDDDKRYELVTVKRRNGGIVSRGHLYGREILVKNYSEVASGDFLISKRQVVHGATGIIPSRLGGAIVSNEYLVVVGNSYISTEFLMLIAKQPPMYRKFFLSSYGVDIEKLFFDVEDWKTRAVIIPNLDEQHRIGSFFKSLDHMIELHQRKHDKLVILKQAMLQKMFPQDGATTPEIRFKGFEGDWVEVQLGNVVDITTGKLDANAMIIGGAYDFYTSGRKKYKINVSAFEGPAITIAGNGATVGYMHMADGKFNAYQRTYVLSSFLVTREFVFYGVKRPLRQKISEEARAGNIPYIVMDMLTDLVIKSPRYEEQEKIGNYFHNLDNLISKYTTQLEKLKNIKSACLDKMFV